MKKTVEYAPGMSKPEKLYVEGKDYFLWPYEEQTQMKHKVVTDYFKFYPKKKKEKKKK